MLHGNDVVLIKIHPVIVDDLRKLIDAAAREGGLRAELKRIGNLPSQFHLHTGSAAVGHVLAQCRPHVVERPSGDQLVLVHHVVSGQPPGIRIGVPAPSKFYIGQALGLICEARWGVDKVVAARLLVGHCHGEKQALFVVQPVVQAHLGIEKVKRGTVARHIDGLLVVVRTIGLIAHATVLQLSLGLQSAIIGTLHKARKGIPIELDPIPVVITVGRPRGYRGVARPDDLPKVGALVTVPCAPQCERSAVPTPLSTKHATVEIIVEPSAAYQVGRRHRVAALHHLGKVVIGQVVTRFVLLEIPLPVGEVTRCRKAPVPQRVLEVQLLVVLSVIVDFVLVGVIVWLGDQA